VVSNIRKTKPNSDASRPRPGWRAYAVILVGFAATQLVLYLLVTPNRSFGNVQWYYAMGEQMRASGLFAVWTPYPPLFSLSLYGGITLLRSWSTFLHGWQVLNVALVLAIAGVIHRILARSAPRDALPAATGFVLVNAITSSAIAIGYYMDQYDYLPILLMMVSVAALESDRPLRSAFWCALGAMAKIFPAVVMPVAILTVDRRWRMQYAVVFAVVALILTLPWLIVAPSNLRSFLRVTVAHEGWETIWTFPHIQFPPTPAPPGYFLVPFDGSGAPAFLLPWLTVITVIAMVAYLAWWRRQPAKDAPAAVLALLLILLIFSKSISSYYPLWLFPLIFVVYRPVQACAICLVFLLVGNIEHVPQRGAYWMAIWSRHMLLVGLLAHVVLTQFQSVTVSGNFAPNLRIQPTREP
jgi:hypothetical protein